MSCGAVIVLVVAMYFVSGWLANIDRDDNHHMDDNNE